VRGIAGPLLAWFDRHKRDLPWRRTSDPYRIWVSEVMLQQTQVDRVIGYYERFMAAFPTVEALAQAPLDEVLRHWEGLGYYSRARNLHAAAQSVVGEHGGVFPRTYEALRALPGVGEYTAGAVLSIACGEPLPAVDANVIRVLARLFALQGDATEVQREVAARAREVLPEERPGDFNQALMELGALICIPGRPGCLICPLTDACDARREGLQDRIPEARSQPLKQMAEVAGVVHAGERVLIAKRPAEGQWGGLWEFPSTRLRPGDEPRQALAEHLLRTLGVELEVGECLTQFAYGVMNRRVELTVHRCRQTGGEVAPTWHDEARWALAGELEALAMPSPHRTVADLLVGAR